MKEKLNKSYIIPVHYLKYTQVMLLEKQVNSITIAYLFCLQYYLSQCSIGLQKWCKNNNLMHSLGTKCISTAVFTSQLSTLKSAIEGTSQTRPV